MDDEQIVLTESSITSGSQADVFKQQMEVPDELAKSLGLKTDAEPPKTEPAAETKTEPVVEIKTEPQSTPPTDGTVKPEIKTDKVPYTEDELKALVNDPRFESGEIKLDTSRLRDSDKASYLEFQRGFTKKFEGLKRQTEEIERKRQEIAAFEERQRQAAEEARFQKESAELGEDEAKRLQKERELEARLQQLEADRQAYLQREASEQFRRAYVEVAPKYHLSTEQPFEDQVMAFTYGKNLTNQKNGEPLITLEDGARGFADFIGITNLANLEKIVNANPANAEALKNKIINEYLKQTRNAGATVVSTTQGQVETKPINTENSPFDAVAYQKDPEGYMASRVKKILSEKNLTTK